MGKNKKVAILTIKNSVKKMDLMRVHIYEKSIRFDKRIEKAIKNLPELKDEVEEMNSLWEQQKIDSTQILPIVLHLMGKYGHYLKDFYFKKNELDKNGSFNDKDSRLDSISEIPMYNPKEEKQFFFDYSKKEKILKIISKKLFESNIPDDEIANEYVENYMTKGARFYTSRIIEEDFASDWFFMTSNNKLIMSYEKLL